MRLTGLRSTALNCEHVHFSANSTVEWSENALKQTKLRFSVEMGEACRPFQLYDVRLQLKIVSAPACIFHWFVQSAS